MQRPMKNLFNLSAAAACGLMLILGCGGESHPPAAADPNERPVAVQAKSLTKEYDDNELAADSKYKGKLLAVTGKVTEISETFGTINASLEGHDAVSTVMCSFADAERQKVSALKKGDQTTLVGRNEGSTAGLFVGLQNCRVDAK